VISTILATSCPWFLDALARLAGKLDQGFEHALLLLGPKDQIRMRAVRGFLEAARSILLDRRPAVWGNLEVVSIAEHGEKHGSEVPRRPVVRWRDIVDVGVGQGVVRHVAVIALDARGGVGGAMPISNPLKTIAVGQLSTSFRQLGISRITLYSWYSRLPSIGWKAPAISDSSLTLRFTSSTPECGECSSGPESSSRARFVEKPT